MAGLSDNARACLRRPLRTLHEIKIGMKKTLKRMKLNNIFFWAQQTKLDYSIWWKRKDKVEDGEDFAAPRRKFLTPSSQWCLKILCHARILP
ncbi:hypothetical protein M0802_010584 [Mischocyttarus mexicanus]|nr:hypothetical protein M0802_010584 [Mischocyttarus mexicanus]